jgi:alkanesulfonate monooxygenase SsuD/methylene tetrahydromethanopterin reductase-like flavin-dependent oxidoreductase (luciferase family)
MSDYGHELHFGSFVTPTADDPSVPVRLAQLSERVGLDLVTFQDHPYQARFLDTWTLMSYVAAATSTISIAPNVANLPLRPPAVLARAAASLDLLSGGRVELGIGAGGFWDAIEAMGGRRLAPGQAVDALAEAIAVIRAVWDADERGGVRIDGAHYRVVGAKRGPRPAHEIGLWVGAYKPRMLELAGRVADGWLPSLGYLDVADFASSNAHIDAAAEAAGRAPASVRRLLNLIGGDDGPLAGPPSQWVEVLTGFAVEHGFSTFILGGDDPTALQVFAAEVAPAVRASGRRPRRPSRPRSRCPRRKARSPSYRRLMTGCG